MSENKGLYEKFIVHRTDGQSEPGRKHHDCRYFVIDIDHDKRAAPALAAYARAARADGDVRLAEDLERFVRDALRKRVDSLLKEAVVGVAE